MREMPWRAPVWVTLQNGMKRQFCGPYDALDFLENEWPRQGMPHARAVQVCREALHHSEYANSARNCFIAACVEASLAYSEAENLGSRAEAKMVSRHR
ncbi:hypothetical protein J2Z50_003350 [Ensifer mexicanus]|uniref:DUF982 domain-containing protein n=2 Tax=Sinorhizobium mexicanum TaxID=375549 RepID=A0A859R3Y1_9HYPH|nr:hypothetical protein [Sinorhizobium mexicanum]QLL64328.1 DUF982 domain-containing protein [Sinorhizobium mexicanum]